jgi:EmrB/QacA subfamily drug resistance transporter
MLSMADPYKGRYLILAVVLAAVLMSVLDGIVVGIALPTITASFRIGVARSQWTITAYLLTLTALLLVFGKVSERTGKARLFIAGLAVFTLASLACGLSRSLEALIGFRVIQAVGGAMTFSISGAIIYPAFPPEERGRAMGFLGSTVAVGSILGPVLGGFLVDSLGWPSIFFINVPIGVLLVAGALLFLDRKEARSPRLGVDWAGAAALAVSLVSLTVLLGSAAQGAGFPAVAGAGAVFLLASALFLAREARARNPLLDLALFRDRSFSLPVLGMMLAFVSNFIVNVSGPFYFQGVMGLSPSQVGLVFLVVPVVTVVGSPLGGLLYDKRRWSHYATVGLCAVSAALLIMSWLAYRVSFAPMIPAFALLGLGSALFQSPNSTDIMNALPRDKLNTASSVTATVRNLGMTIGTSVGALLIAAQLSGAGYHGPILEAGKPLLARVLAVVIASSGVIAAAAAILV